MTKDPDWKYNDLVDYKHQLFLTTKDPLIPQNCNPSKSVMAMFTRNNPDPAW